MWRDFWKGLIAGGFLGAILGSNFLVPPQKKKMVSKRIVGQSKKLRRRAQKMVEDISSGITDYLKDR